MNFGHLLIPLLSTDPCCLVTLKLLRHGREAGNCNKHLKGEPATKSTDALRGRWEAPGDRRGLRVGPPGSRHPSRSQG